MENQADLFPQEDAFAQMPLAPSATLNITPTADSKLQKEQPKWKIMTESEEYLHMLQERHDALKSGKVAPRPRTNKNQMSPFADAFEVDWDTFEVDSQKYPEDQDILADVREQLEYDVAKVETIGRNLIEETQPKTSIVSSSPETSDNEADSSEDSSSSDDEVEFANEFRGEMMDAFAFARYVDEEPEEELIF